MSHVDVEEVGCHDDEARVTTRVEPGLGFGRVREGVSSFVSARVDGWGKDCEHTSPLNHEIFDGAMEYGALVVEWSV